MISARFFGGAVLYENDDRLGGPPSQRHRLALLAILAAAHPRSISREQAIGLLWPDRSESRARNLLNQSLYALRQAFGAEHVVSSGEDIRLAPEGLDIDVVRFTDARSAGRLREAVDLYEGAFLEGFTLPDAASFGPWVDGERERFRRECADALQTIARSASASGRHAEAVRSYRRLTALDPYSASATVGLMEALVADGDPAAALRQAAVHGHLMRQEFDSGAAPEVEACAHRIRTRAAPVRHDAPEKVPGDGERRPPEAEISFDSPEGAGLPVSAGSSRWSDGSTRRRAGLLAAAAVFVLLALAIGQAVLPADEPPADPPRVLVTAPGATRADDVARWAASVLADALAGMAPVVDATPAEPRDVAASSADRAAPDHTTPTIVIEVRSVADASGVELRALVHTPDGTADEVVAPRVDSDALDRTVAGLAQNVRRALGDASRGVRITSEPVFVPDRAAFGEFVRGFDLAVNGRPGESIAYFRRAARLDPDWPRPVIHEAIWEWNQAETQRVDSLLAFVEAMPAPLSTEDRGFVNLVRSWLGNDPRQKRDAARAMAELRPNSLTHVQWASEELALNGPDSALAVVAGIDSTAAEVRSWRSYWGVRTIIYHRLGRHRDELEVARRAEEALPGDPSALFQQARALIALDSVPAAWTLAKRMLANPQRANRQLPGSLARHLGDVVLALHSEAEAAPFYEAAVQWFREAPPAERSSPFNEGAFLNALLRAEGVGSAQAALDSLDVGLSEIQRAGYTGVFAALTGDTVRADSAAEWLTTSAPRYRTYEPFEWRARIAVSLGRLEDARELLERAAERGGRWYRYDPLLAPVWPDATSLIPAESR